MDADSLIFDLDGTLWDTCDVCAVAWNLVIARNGISFREIAGDDVRSVAGRPHRDCIEIVFDGLAESEIETLTRETMTEDNRLIAERGGYMYPNLSSVIPGLAEVFTLGIVSNCQTGYIETFLEWTKLDGQFADFESWGNTGNSKSSNLASLIERNQLRRPVFIGDTPGDQEAARDNGVAFIYARYGFGEVIGADAEINDLQDLAEVVSKV